MEKYLVLKNNKVVNIIDNLDLNELEDHTLIELTENHSNAVIGSIYNESEGVFVEPLSFNSYVTSEFRTIVSESNFNVTVEFNRNVLNLTEDTIEIIPSSVYKSNVNVDNNQVTFDVELPENCSNSIKLKVSSTSDLVDEYGSQCEIVNTIYYSPEWTPAPIV